MRYGWLVLCGATFALGCRATIPDDTFACASSQECPPDFACVDGFCRSGNEPGQDGGPSGDGGMDGGTDARVELDAGGECGNGVLDPGEDCDDGKVGGDEDGCTDACEFTCTENADCADTDVCNGAEVCDTTDHTCGAGTPAADGVECGSGMVCFTGACITPVCGNSIVEPTEQCDDGMNGDDTDGCTDDCERTCSVDADCIDTNPCNGTESCNTAENRRVAGTALDDGVSCGAGPEVCFSAICVTPVCGNSTVEPGEDCDTGGESATCNADCTVAVCGDGVVNAAAGEDCDDGNTIDTDGCPSGSAGMCRCPPGVPCGPTAINRAFVTSTTHVPGSLGGVAEADAICNARASAAGLPGTYVAWLSSSTSDAATRLGSASGWVRTDGRPFAASREDLFAGRLLYPLELDETGALVPASPVHRVVATGTRVDGTSSLGFTCSDWTSTSGQTSGGGFDSSKSNWTTSLTPSCGDRAYRLYCLGIDHASTYVVKPVPGRVAFVSVGTLAPNAGRAAADSLCQTEADDAGLSGTFRALLGSSTASAGSMLSTSGGPWVRPDGVPLADTAADVVSGAPLLTRIVLGADGSTVSANIVWTGGAAIGSTGLTCMDWSSASGSERANIGEVDMQGIWFGRSSSTVACNFSDLAVYCFQQ